MRQTLFLILSAVAAFLFFSPAWAENMRLVHGGEANGRIVVPCQTTRAEQFAAEELQVYLKKITGVEVSIERTMGVPSGPVIIVGSHPGNLEVNQNLQSQYPLTTLAGKMAGNRDAFAVVGEGSRLHLFGNSDTAVLYAIWDWLEFLGVRWIMPGELGTYIPSRKEIVLAPIHRIEGPGMAFRGPNYVMPVKWEFPPSATKPEHGIPASWLYSYRQRLNCNVDFESADAWSTVGSGHSYLHYLPPARYFKNHPEWYNLINGMRQSGPGWQLCFTNRDSAREFAKNMMGTIAGTLKQGVPLEHMQIYVSPNDLSIYGNLSLISIYEQLRTGMSLNDGRAWCECPNCQKLRDADGSATSMVTNYANWVAAEIRKQYPQARILFYAYDNYVRPGDHVKPGPGVCPQLTFWPPPMSVGANHAHPMFSQANPKFEKYFAQWAKLCEQISAHEYYGHYAWFTPWPKLTQMAHDLPILAKEPKFYGMYSESHLHWGTQGPNFYLQPRLMWNPKLDVTAVMDDYYAKGFGPAGPHVKRHYQILQQQMDGLPCIRGYLTEIPQLLTPAVIAQCNECMNQAEILLSKMDPGTRWRTELLIQAWRASAKTAQAFQLCLNPRPQPHDRETVVRLLTEVLQFAGTEQGRWAFEYRMAKPGIEGILRPISLNLNELPAGTHVADLYLTNGGPLKFFGDIFGFVQGIDGYRLDPRRRGAIDLPLGTVKGKKIIAARVGLVLGRKRGYDLKVSVVDALGQKRQLAKGIAPCERGVTVPRELLGRDKIVLEIEAENQSLDSQPVLCGLKVNVTVQ